MIFNKNSERHACIWIPFCKCSLFRSFFRARANHSTRCQKKHQKKHTWISTTTPFLAQFPHNRREILRNDSNSFAVTEWHFDWVFANHFPSQNALIVNHGYFWAIIRQRPQLFTSFPNSIQTLWKLKIKKSFDIISTHVESKLRLTALWPTRFVFYPDLFFQRQFWSEIRPPNWIHQGI